MKKKFFEEQVGRVNDDNVGRSYNDTELWRFNDTILGRKGVDDRKNDIDTGA